MAQGLHGAEAFTAPCPAWLQNQGLPQPALCRSTGGDLAQLQFLLASEIPSKGSRNLLLHKARGNIGPLVGNGVTSHCPRAPEENSFAWRGATVSLGGRNRWRPEGWWDLCHLSKDYSP